jgi:hypothetical protein
MQSNRLEIAARYESNVVFDQIVMTFHKRPLIILNLDITVNTATLVWHEISPRHV